MFSLGGDVVLGITTSAAVHVGNVYRCGSPWACPICSPRIGERRAVEIDRLISAAMAAGHEAVFVTGTVRHKHGDDLGHLLDGLAASWRKTVNDKRRVGMLGGVRSYEVLDGVNGWHPHIHAVLFAEHGVSATKMAQRLGSKWHDGLRAQGMTASHAHGWHVAPISANTGSLSEYLTKVQGGWGAGLEVARADLKTRRQGRAPFDLLADAGDEGAATAKRAMARWLTYESATKGRRRIVVSPGLRGLFDLEPEATDEELAIDTPTDDLRAEARVPSSVWARLLAQGRAATAIAVLRDLVTVGELPDEAMAWLLDLVAIELKDGVMT
jgi:hypothetical protein